MDRRDFLKLMGIAGSTSLLAGCNLDRNSEKLIPYLVPPDDGVVPGEATYVASTCTECPGGCGVSARIRDARVVKLEGLAGHPVGEGALCIRGQASLNRLYNEHRIRQPLAQDGNGNLVPVTWNQAYARIIAARGDGTSDDLLLSGRTTGSLSALIDEFCNGMAVTRLPEYELYSYAAIREANRQLFGRPIVPGYHIDKADFLLTVGADLVETFGNPVTNQRQLTRARKSGHFGWSHIEPHSSLTGFHAGHRMVVRAGTEAYILAHLLGELGRRRIFPDRRLERLISAIPDFSADEVAANTGLDREAVDSLVTEFMAAKHALIIAGGVSTQHDSGLDVARLAALLQMATGMIGSTVDLDRVPDFSRVGTGRDMQALEEKLEKGDVGMLFVLNTDPAGQIGGAFTSAMLKADFIVGIGDVLNDTTRQCDVVLPSSHALESWGDVESIAGVVSVVQPVMKPVLDTRSPGDVLLGLMTEAGLGAQLSYQNFLIVRWSREYGAARAQELVDRGFTTTPVRSTTVTIAGGAGMSGLSLARQASKPRLPVVVTKPSLRNYDGRSAVLPLLREIPDPVSAVSWDEWVSVSPKTAEKLGVKDRDVLQISGGGFNVKLAARIQPGLPEGVYTIERGTSHAAAWIEGSGEVSAFAFGVTVNRIAGKQPIPILAGSLTEEGRGVVPGSHPEHFGHPPGGHHEHEEVSFNPKPNYPTYRWSMAVDMDLCTGCSACVAACYVENNIPMVGRKEHLKGREMSWIRIEPYFSKEGESADFVPMMCQQCDYAPCESVCPVFATYHNEEGLNAQIYNRCVGTRYCANNCPYKQRRFNWFDHSNRPQPLNQMVNPDVSVRGAGVMEKCTFCVQRIRKARDTAKDENRNIREGEVVPACAQTCPSSALVFGNLLDQDSEVYKWSQDERAVRVLEEVGAGPGVYYLKKKGKDHHDA